MAIAPSAAPAYRAGMQSDLDYLIRTLGLDANNIERARALAQTLPPLKGIPLGGFNWSSGIEPERGRLRVRGNMNARALAAGLALGVLLGIVLEGGTLAWAPRSSPASAARRWPRPDRRARAPHDQRMRAPRGRRNSTASSVLAPALRRLHRFPPRMRRCARRPRSCACRTTRRSAGRVPLHDGGPALHRARPRPAWLRGDIEDGCDGVDAARAGGTRARPAGDLGDAGAHRAR